MSSSCDIYQEKCPKCKSKYMFVSVCVDYSDNKRTKDKFCPDCNYEHIENLEDYKSETEDDNEIKD